MEVVIELIVELVAQLFIEGALEGVGETTGKSLRSRRARSVVRYSLSLALALLAGLAWGIYVAGTGRDALPRSVWVSTALAAVCLILAVIAHVRRLPVEDRLSGWRAFRRPDRWPASRWWLFVVMSNVIAVAIAVGFRIAQS